MTDCERVRLLMDELSDLTRRPHAHLNTELQRRLESLLSGECNEVEFVEAVRGKCSENEFIDAIAVQLRAVPASKPQVLAVIDRLRSRGEVPVDLVRFLESRIAADPLPKD